MLTLSPVLTVMRGARRSGISRSQAAVRLRRRDSPDEDRRPALCDVRHAREISAELDPKDIIATALTATSAPLRQ